ncbi:MAG: extracellular solute-binding protein, partial [Clostridia bacterium]|nr:extracellular solute-binding protein [Clostridia bacterium]
MNAKRLLSMLLCLLMLATSAFLVACGGGEEESSSAAVSNGTTGENIEDYVTMPEFKWQGEEYEEFTVLIYSNETQTTYYCEDVEPDLYDSTDASLNDAVSRRNDEILAKYGVTVKGVPVADVQTDLKEDITSDLCMYDAALPFMPAAASLAQEGYLYDLNEFEGYLHLDQAWWDQSANKSLSIGGKLYFTTGDISIMTKIVSTAITFNKEILQKTFPDTDLYQMVKDRTWTFDKMIEMSRATTAETDGTTGMTYNDNWGLSSSYGDVSAFFIASGNNYISKNSDDIPVITFNNTA